MNVSNLAFRSLLDGIADIYFNLVSIIDNLFQFFSMSIPQMIAEDPNDQEAVTNIINTILDFLDDWTFSPSWLIDMYRDILTQPLIVFLFGSAITIILTLSIIKWIIGIFT